MTELDGKPTYMALSRGLLMHQSQACCGTKTYGLLMLHQSGCSVKEEQLPVDDVTLAFDHEFV